MDFLSNKIKKTHMDKIIKSLELYLDDNMATQTEIDRFVLFIQKLKSSRRVRFIYRGDSNIIEQYKTDSQNLSLLAHYIFCLGDKGRYFYQNKLVNRNSIFSIIWEKFHNKVCKLDFASDGTKERMSEFLKENPMLNKYFSDEHNKERFESLSQLSIAEANKIADYYLSILHTIGKSGNDKSNFLSSSTNYLVADKFKGDNNIIIYGWLPKKGIKSRIIKYTDVETNSQLVKSLNLPIYQFPIYPEQCEICIKCGLLPHFIIGFQHDNIFHINPNTLKQWNDNILYEGLDIDQKHFNDLFNATKLRQSFMFIDGNYYVISKEGVFEV